MRYIIYASLKNEPNTLIRIDEYGNLRAGVDKIKELRSKRNDVNYMLVDSLLQETIEC